MGYRVSLRLAQDTEVPISQKEEEEERKEGRGSEWPLKSQDIVNATLRDCNNSSRAPPVVTKQLLNFFLCFFSNSGLFVVLGMTESYLGENAKPSFIQDKELSQLVLKVSGNS